MKRLATLLLLLGVALGQSRPLNKPSTQEHRFTMLNVTVMVQDQTGSSQHQESQVLLLDSETGQVWLYTPELILGGGESKKVQYNAAGFYKLYVDGVSNPSSRPIFKTLDK
jgi:hypothetical protein